MRLNEKTKNILVYFLKISITIGLLVFLFTNEKLHIKDIIINIKKTDLFYFSLAVILFGVNYFLGILRWNILLRGVGIIVPVSRITISYLMGLAVNLFIPSTIGGDLARGIDLSIYSSNSKSKLLATVMLDRLSGYVAVVLICLFSVVFGYGFVNDMAVLVSLGLLVVFLLAFLLLIFNMKVYNLFKRLFKRFKHIGSAIDSFKETLMYFRSQKKFKPLFFTLLMALIIQVLAVFITYLISKSMKFDVGLIYFFIFVPIISAISVIPLTISGLGSRDVSSVYFFTRVGFPASWAESISLISFFLFIITGVIGGIVYVFTLHTRRVQHNKTVTQSK